MYCNKPLGHESYNRFFYNGLEVSWPYWNDLTERFEQASQIQGTSLALFNIDGVPLENKTRNELIETFGATPDNYSLRDRAYMSLRYHIALRDVEFVLEFWFDYPDVPSRILALWPLPNR